MAKKRKTSKKLPRDAHGVRAVARKNRSAAKKHKTVTASWSGPAVGVAPTVIPVVLQIDPVAGPVLLVPKEVPVKRVHKQSWAEFLFGTNKW